MPCIECIWGKDNRFLVNPDGQVWPCCYLGNIGYTEKINGRFKDTKLINQGVDDVVHPIIQEYFENAEDLNIKNKTIPEILNHKWFTETLPNSWTGNRPHRHCRVFCDKDGKD